jgi:hypothetical protein
MHSGQLIFSQLVEFLPRHAFNKCVARYGGNRRVRRFRCWDQFLVMAFAQLTFRESLRDIETCLRAMPKKLYHAGIRATVARSTLAEANESRDWHIWADFAAVLIAEARVADMLATLRAESVRQVLCTCGLHSPASKPVKLLLHTLKIAA